MSVPGIASTPFAVRAVVAAIISSAVSIAWLPTALAAEGEDIELDEVQVTGSRILQRQDYVSPNPVQTVDSTQLEQLGIVNMGDAINLLPVNVSSFQPRNQGGNPFFVGSTLANLRGLNPYFGTRTLTLVDSRRFVPTNQGQSVDLGFIPSVLVNRMEVVTGGASAAYGSDAVSGVVNIILDNRLEGVKAQVDYGVTERGDGGNVHAGLAFGTGVAQGRGHFVFGVEYQDSNSIDDCSAARSWCRDSNGLLTNGGNGFEALGATYVPRTPGLPYRYRASNLRLNQINAAGVIYDGSGAATTISANAAGTGVSNFAIGQLGNVSPTQTAIGGDGASINAVTSLYPDLNRKTAYAHLDFDLTDSISSFVEGSYGQSKGFVTQSGPGLTTTNICVNTSANGGTANPYLSGAFGAAVTAAAGNYTNDFVTIFSGCASPSQTMVRKDWNEQTNRYVNTDTKVLRFATGLQGRFGDSDWNWSGYYQFGHTKRDQLLHDNITAKRLAFALDAVDDGSGNIVCRVTRDGVPNPLDAAAVALAPGCVPLNPFGTGALTQAQHDYAFGNLSESNVIKQHVVDLSVSGPLWSGWGYGPLSAAAGVEYRQEKLTNDAGDEPFYQRTDFAAQYGDPFAGTTKVQEGFVELEMPVLADMTGAKLVQVNAAARRTRYNTKDDLVAANPSTKVSVTTWKFASVWDPVDWLRIRGSLSRDLRAAGFRELYYSQTIPSDPPGTVFGFGGVNNPWIAGPNNYDPATVNLSGNSSLKPEKATTTTIGFVLSPQGWADSLHFSLDWYRIKLVNGISGGIIAKTVQLCDAGDAFYCSQIEGTVSGTGPEGQPEFSDITALRAPYENGRPYRAEGLDMTSDYRLPLNKFFESAQGSLMFRATATRALKTELETLIYPNWTKRNVVGQVGPAGFLADYAPTPKWKGDLTVSYLRGPVTMTLQTQWTGPGKLNNETPYVGPGDVFPTPLAPPNEAIAGTPYDPNRAGTVDDNTVGNYFNFNLNGSYDIKSSRVNNAQVFVSISNLFDRDPPYSSGAGFGANGGIGGVNGVFYDTLGRTYRAGIRVKF